MRRSACALAFALLWTQTACLRLTWAAGRNEEPIDEVAVAHLQPGSADLGACLRMLGAPHFVWEYHGSGMALGWVAGDEFGLTLEASYTFERFATGRVTASMLESELPGLVLWFDEQLHLERLQRGRMRDLVQGLQRPSAIGDDH